MKRISLIALLLCALAPAFGQTADEILTKNAKAMGGAESVADLKTITSHGMVTMMNGMTVETETYLKGDKMYAKQTIKAMNAEIVMGCDGKDCYAQDPYMGLRLLTGQEKEQQILTNDLTAIFKWKENYPKREFKGTDKLDGKDVYKIFLESKTGMATLQYIDQATYMVVKSDVTVNGPQGEVSIEIYFDEYKDVYKGFKMPVKMHSKSMGMDMTIVFDKYEVNVDIPDSKFKLPDGLK